MFRYIDLAPVKKRPMPSRARPRGRAVIHFMSHAVSALRFVDPITQRLRQDGFYVELWVEAEPPAPQFRSALTGPVRTSAFSLVPNPLVVLARAISLLSELWKAQPLVIHAHQTRGSLLPLLCAFVLGVPIRIYQNHGSAYWGTSGTSKRLFGILERLNCALATTVVFVNPNLREVFIKDHIVSAGKTMQILPGSSCGIDVAAYRSDICDVASQRRQRLKLRIPLDDFVVLYVGRPHKRKGFHFLLNAWRESQFNAVGNTLLIAGAANEDVADVMREAIPPSVRALGYYDDIISLYVAADVIVLPSEYEGVPYSLLEAAACGRPLIASDIPGIKMILRNGVQGLVHPTGDTQRFISCLQRLKYAPDLRLQFGQEARTSASRFAREAILEQISDLYRVLLSDADGRCD